MSVPYEHLTKMAEDIGLPFLQKKGVNLDRIAEKNNIAFVKGRYGKCFLGQLVHYDDDFYIVLNNDQLKNSEKGRVRFTIAHELGHFFIKEHRQLLESGISLSYTTGFKESTCKSIEAAANHFAAALLMPPSDYMKNAKCLDEGFPCIIALKKRYDSSIEATSIQYLNLNLSISMMIRWENDFSIKYVRCSKSFYDMTGLKRKPSIKSSPEYIHTQIKSIEKNGSDFIENAKEV